MTELQAFYATVCVLVVAISGLYGWLAYLASFN